MSTKVTKAVIAAAGRGTRFLPTVKAYAKELVPIINKPNIQYLVEEAIAAGITDLCIVHREGETTIKSYFTPDSDLEKYLEKISNKKGIHLIDVPIDYSDDYRILVKELQEKTCIL